MHNAHPPHHAPKPKNAPPHRRSFDPASSRSRLNGVPAPPIPLPLGVLATLFVGLSPLPSQPSISAIGSTSIPPSPEEAGSGGGESSTTDPAGPLPVVEAHRLLIPAPRCSISSPSAPAPPAPAPAPEVETGVLVPLAALLPPTLALPPRLELRDLSARPGRSRARGVGWAERKVGIGEGPRGEGEGGARESVGWANVEVEGGPEEADVEA